MHDHTLHVFPGWPNPSEQHNDAPADMEDAVQLLQCQSQVSQALLNIVEILPEPDMINNLSNAENWTQGVQAQDRR